MQQVQAHYWPVNEEGVNMANYAGGIAATSCEMVTGNLSGSDLLKIPLFCPQLFSVHLCHSL